MDGGRTLLIKAARVKESYQGGGVYGRFRRRLLEHFAGKQQYPLLERESAIRNEKNMTAERQEALLKSGWRLLQVKVMPVNIIDIIAQKTVSHGMGKGVNIIM
jgi:hypothetical protein